MIQRWFSILLVVILAICTLALPAIAFSSDLPLSQQGQPLWQRISFTNLGRVESGNTGILSSPSL
ncbi:MAG: hypothetical protein WCD18_15620, partial [Thermosynechococcaceae cyanobacterium]